MNNFTKPFNKVTLGSIKIDLKNLSSNDFKNYLV